MHVQSLNKIMNKKYIQRGGGGDSGGEGFSGTTIKDTWTKPRWRVEAMEGGGFGWGWGKVWGENSDNCT